MSTPVSAARCSGPAPPSGPASPIRDNLIVQISEAERERWLGEAEGLKISLAGANDKLAQIDRRSRRQPVDLGIPAIPIPGHGEAQLLFLADLMTEARDAFPEVEASGGQWVNIDWLSLGCRNGTRSHQASRGD